MDIMKEMSSKELRDLLRQKEITLKVMPIKNEDYYALLNDIKHIRKKLKENDTIA